MFIMGESLREQTFKGVGWSAVERFSVQGINFFVQVIIARLLLPSDYGIIGMVVIFLQIAQVFIDSGFANALIQKQDCSDKDYSTVFLYNLFIAVLLYILFFLCAPLVANFYKVPVITGVMRFISLTLVLNALSIVQKTKLVKDVDFKSQSKVSLASAVLSGTIGIVLAYKDFGIWALCWQQILNSTFQIFFYFVYVRWIPKLNFDKESFINLFSFSSKLLLASLISVIYRNLYNIVIGKKFSSEDLGYYTRAEQFAMFPSNNLANIIARVAFPVLSKIQDDNDSLRRAYRKIIRYSSFIIFPLMIGLLSLAKPIVVIVLTEKWLATAVLLQILCLEWMFDHISLINLNLLYVKGRTDLALKLEVIKKSIAITILFGSMSFGVVGICWGKVIYSVIAIFINAYYTDKLISLSFRQQVRDFIPYIGAAALTGCSIFFICHFLNNYIIQLCVGLLTGATFYIVLSLIFFKPVLKDFIFSIRKSYGNQKFNIAI